MSKYNDNKFDHMVEITETLLDRPERPADYHCTCEYCTKNFLGEIYNTKVDKYYSQAARKHYYKKQDEMHLCPGHFQGYRWAIQKWTQPGDWVFDPTCGTGTAVVESINHDRNAIGIELEFPNIAMNNVKHQYKRMFEPATGRGKIVHGDARNLKQILIDNGIEHGQLSLVLNGTPYPTMGKGKKSADAPQRFGKKTEEGDREEISFNYENEQNFGLAMGDEFKELIRNLYLDCIPFMKQGALMSILIKDMMDKKAPYLLHKLVVDEVLSSTTELEYYGCYIHKHIPQTLFMTTYNQFHGEDILIPLYQTGIVLRKK